MAGSLTYSFTANVQNEKTSVSLGATSVFDFYYDTTGNPAGIEITVANDSTIGGAAAGGSAYAISGLDLTLNNKTLGAPTSITEIIAGKIAYTKVKNEYTSSTTAVQDYKDPSTSDPDFHWQLNSTKGGVNLTALGGSQPQEMIMAKDASVSSNVTNFNPYFNGTASFFLAFKNLPTTLSTSDIQGVQFQFGTGPEYTKTASGSGQSILLNPKTSPPVAVPEPTSLFSCGLAILMGLGHYSWVRVRTKRAA